MDSDLRVSRRFRLAKVVSNKPKTKQKEEKNEQQKKGKLNKLIKFGILKSA